MLTTINTKKLFKFTFFKRSISSTVMSKMSISLVGKYHCIKSFGIRSFSGPYFPAFELNTERYSKCGEIQTRKTPDTDTFYAMYVHNHGMQAVLAHFSGKYQQYTFVSTTVNNWKCKFQQKEPG